MQRPVCDGPSADLLGSLVGPWLLSRIGVTTDKRSPDITLVVNLISPDGRYDKLYIDNFAYLQVKDATGNWKTVVEDMGIPSGKPKSMAVDLSGKFLSNSREVRTP